MRLNRNSIASFCSRIDLRSQQPKIDLRSVEFIEPFSLIYLGTFVRYWNSKGKYFSFQESQSTKVKRYIDSQNFYERFNFREDEGARQPIFKTNRPTSFEDIIPLDIAVDDPLFAEKIEQWTLDILRHWQVQASPSAISTIVVELIDNAVRHSQQTSPGSMIFQLFPQNRYVEIALADCGVGIRSNLAGKYDVPTDQMAAIKAFEDGVTSKLEGGTGLSTIMEYVARLRGTLFLSTGEAYVRADKKTEYNLESSRAPYNLPGVQVQVTIPV